MVRLRTIHVKGENHEKAHLMGIFVTFGGVASVLTRL